MFSWTGLAKAIGTGIRTIAEELEGNEQVAAGAKATASDLTTTLKSAATSVANGATAEATNLLTPALTKVFGGSTAVAGIATGAIVSALQSEGQSLLSELKL